MKAPGSNSRLTGWAWRWNSLAPLTIFHGRLLGRSGVSTSTGGAGGLLRAGAGFSRAVGRAPPAGGQLAPVGGAAHGPARASVVARELVSLVRVFVPVSGRGRGPLGV